jgi:chaperonin GroES
MLDLEKTLSINKDLVQSPDLTDRFTGADLDSIGRLVIEGYKKDRASRFKWERRMNAAMDLAMQVQVAKTFPWPGCSNVIFPLVTIAALQFSARSYSNMIQGTNVVRYRVIGKDDEKAHERSLRIGKHMSWQVLEQDQAWEEEHDRLLINLAIVGTSYIKSFYDPGLGYPVDELVTARDLVMDYWSKSIERSARVTQHVPLYANEIYERCMRKTFRDVRNDEWFGKAPPSDYDALVIQSDKREGTSPVQPDEDSAYRTLEQHRWFDFDKDGYSEPYICTVEAATGKVLRIIARFEEDSVERNLAQKIIRINPETFYTKYSLIPNPEGACLDLGFGVFLGPINESVNSGINQILDSGTLQNSLGGLLGRGAKMRGGVYTMAPWEFKRVDMSGDDIRKNVYMFPERQPSDVMFKLLGLLVEYANRIAGTVDATVGENPGQNTPASTYQGMTEQGLQIYGMTFKRYWRSQKEEFKKRYALNKKYAETSKRFGSGEDFIRREDYVGNPDQVAPVANPRVTSTIMRTMQAGAVLDAALKIPGFERKEAVRAWLESIEVEGIDRLYPGEGAVQPLPNFRLQIQQIKFQEVQLKEQGRKQIEALKLLEQKRVNNAKIAQLEAQAIKLMKEANVKDIEVQIEALNSLIDAQKDFGEMMNQRIEMLLAGGSEGGEGNTGAGGTDEGGMGQVASAGAHQGAPSSASGSSSGSNGAMGGR